MVFDHSVMHDARRNMYLLIQDGIEFTVKPQRVIDSKCMLETSVLTQKLPMHVPSPTKGLPGSYPG